MPAAKLANKKGDENMPAEVRPPQKGDFKVKISLYSLSCGDKKPREIIELALKYGCSGIEWWCRENGHIDANNLEKSSKDVALMMEKTGLEVAGIAPYFKYNEPAEEVAKIFRAAKILGTKRVRCNSYPFKGEEPFAELMQRQIDWLEKEVLPVVMELDMQLNIEQHHNMICCNANACLQMVEKFPPERIGIIYDPGNSLFEGFTSTEYSLSVMGRYINHVHVKSARYVKEGGTLPRGRLLPMEFCSLERGDLNWEEIIKQLKETGYKGFLSLEALDKRDTETKLSEDIPYIRNILAK